MEPLDLVDLTEIQRANRRRLVLPKQLQIFSVLGFFLHQL